MEDAFVTVGSGAIPALDIDPFSNDFLADPYPHHEVMRESGAVFYLSRYGIYGMARYADVVAALTDWQTYCSGRGVGLSDFAHEAPWRPPSLLLETDPPVHDRTRKLMASVVSNQALKDARPIWREKAERLAEQLVTARSFDAVTDLAEVYPLRVFPDAIGLQDEGREHLLPYAAATFNAFGPRNALFVQANANAADAIPWIAQACQRASLKPGGWGMAVYDAVDRGECSAPEAERLVRSFLSAGIDTTVNGIANMMHAFVECPEQWRRLRADPGLSKRAIEEALRWGSTVQTFFRTTTKTVEVGGHAIPEGSKVLLFLAAANRDPRRWKDAAQFDVARQAGSHAGFGFGIHRCLGQMVARLEMELVLDALLPRIVSLERVGAVKWRLNNTLRAVSSLPIEIHAAH